MSSVPPEYAVGVEPLGKLGARGGVALFLALLVTGLGQAYLGYWRRAVLWAALPLLVELTFLFLVLRFEVRILYGSVPIVAIGAWVVPRVAAFWEVRSLREHPSGSSGFAPLVTFSLAATVYGFAALAFEGQRVAASATIQSSAMQPTLLAQERVMVNLRAYRSGGPLRGELALFGSDISLSVKRVIGLPGDRVELHDGALLINGWTVPHCELGALALGGTREANLELEFLAGSAYLTLREKASNRASRTWSVRPGEVFLLSDDRNSAEDLRAGSAAHDHGIPSELIKGRPAFVFLGLDYEQNLDWSRFGSALDTPQLPTDLKALDLRLKACLANRPQRNRTEPPVRL
jgi:signal peptidase I